MKKSLADAFEMFQQKFADTLKDYTSRINGFLDMYGQTSSMLFALDEEYLRGYIFDKQSDDQRLRFWGTKKFYEFIQESILNLPLKQRIPFPIEENEIIKSAKTTTRKAKESGIRFLSKEFDLNNLFDDIYYQHLKDYNAIVTAKAAIALIMSAAYDTTKIDSMNLAYKSDKMKIDDYIELDEFGVKVRNFENPRIDWVGIQGKCALYIQAYFKIRKEYQVKKEDENYFFVRMWKSENLHFDPTVEGKKSKKPYSVYALIKYMLKYISINANLPFLLYTSDLPPNAVLHSLYMSKGAYLQEIIEVFGYQTFVDKAFKKYCEDSNNAHFFGLKPFLNDTEDGGNVDFFNQTSSDDTVVNFESDEDKIYLVVKRNVGRFRDTYKTKKLKMKYKHTCQICGKPFELVGNLHYSEVHHIHPHGKPHFGPDEYYNMIVLCPNHHALIDLGIVSINPEDQETIMHVDQNNFLNGRKLMTLPNHYLSPSCIRYHYVNFFLPVLNKYHSNAEIIKIV